MDLQLNIDRLSFTLASAEALSFGLEDNGSIDFDLETPIAIGVNTYDGPYEVTPSNEMQTLNTNDLLMTQNVTINPIPNNYGLITWNGSTLTVS